MKSRLHAVLTYIYSSIQVGADQDRCHETLRARGQRLVKEAMIELQSTKSGVDSRRCVKKRTQRQVMSVFKYKCHGIVRDTSPPELGSGYLCTAALGPGVNAALTRIWFGLVWFGLYFNVL